MRNKVFHFALGKGLNQKSAPQNIFQDQNEKTEIRPMRFNQAPVGSLKTEQSFFNS